MGKYIIQWKKADWDKWEQYGAQKYDTLEDAKRAFNQIPFKVNMRIAEEYTVVRYKAVKL